MSGPGVDISPVRDRRPSQHRRDPSTFGHCRSRPLRLSLPAVPEKGP